MSEVAALVSDHLDIWTAATERKNGAGRGGGKRMSLYGVERLRALIFDLAAAGRLEGNPNLAPEPLGKHVDLVMGQAPPGSACNTTGVGTVFVKTGEFGPIYPEVREWTTKPLKMAQAGDVLICVVGATIGKLNLAIDCAIGRSVAAIRPKPSLETRYLYYALMPYTLRLRRDARGSAQGVIGKSELNAVAIRVPTLKEQQQIVAKVDELMALCDALEGESAAALAAHQTLVETLLATLVNSADAADLAANWSRLEAHFDTLFTTEASVDTLKQTVLELAVRGRLTRPEHEDGQVDQLLAAIAEHRKVKAKQGRRRMPDVPARAVDGAEIPFVIPEHWQFARFQDVLINRDAERIPVSSEERVGRKGEYDYYGASGVIDKIDGFLFEEPLLLIGEDGANLINRSTPIAFVARGKYWVNNHAHVLEAFSETLLRYMEIFINAIDLKPYVTGTAQPKMNQAKMNSIIVALPPADEMKRVIAKVDALMVLCDDLKARITKAGQIQMRLADTIVERAAA